MIAKREEAIHQSQLRLEEKTRNVGPLQVVGERLKTPGGRLGLTSVVKQFQASWAHRVTSLEPIPTSEKWANHSSTCSHGFIMKIKYSDWKDWH